MPSDSPTAADRNEAPPEGSGPSVSPDSEDVNAQLLSQLSVGAVVDGKYRVDRVLGRGAMGVVVQATHVHLGEAVALKFLQYRAKSGTEDFQSRFRREAKVSAKLKNEHITRVIDVGVYKDRIPFMVMDYLDGTDLRQQLKATGGPLPVGTAIDYIVQVCVGIAEAHANGIVHRDLKPSNLFVVKRPDGSDLVKILDFGISKWRASETELDELTQTGVVLGSPKYMAPEQLFGSSDVDARADVWSIGAILYELLCGRPPFDLPTFTRICAELSTNNPPPSLVARRSEITPELEAVVMACFQRDPAHRTKDVAQLAGDLLEAVDAPFAEPMRQKIAAVLDPTINGLGASGARSATSGTYHPLNTSGALAALTTTGSTTGKRAQRAAAEVDVPIVVTAPEPAPRRRGGVLVAVIAGVLLLSGAAYVLLTRPAEGVASTPGIPSAPASAAAAVVPPPAEPPLSVTPSAAAAPVASVAAAPSAPAIATADTGRNAHPPPPTWHPAPVVAHPTPAPSPPPPATVAAQPVVPAPPPPPTATTKVDPLGDRQ